MAISDPTTHPARRVAGPDHQLPAAGDAGGSGRSTSVAGLVRELADDTRTLIRQEIELAKAEAAATAKRVAVDSAWIGAGAGLAAVGALCLVFALALGLGVLLGSYWLGTLITGVVVLLIAGLMAWRGVRDLKAGGLVPTRTTESLRADAEWAREEARDFKEGLGGEAR
jgi:predicted lipid-binding transport protein (Tim44 family)